MVLRHPRYCISTFSRGNFEQFVWLDRQQDNEVEKLEYFLYFRCTISKFTLPLSYEKKLQNAQASCINTLPVPP